MTKAIRVIVLLVALSSFTPALTTAEQTPVRISAAYNSDSDSVSFTSYSIATEKKNKPWNFYYTVTNINQRDSTARLTEQRFITRWQQRINEENSFSAWVGYSYSENWQFAPFGVQYQGVVNTIDQLRLSYAHDSVTTVAAYQNRIMSDSLSLNYVKEIDRRLKLDTLVKVAKYTDENFRNTFGLSFVKDVSRRFRLGLAYLYDTSDVDKRSVYYLPKEESSLSIVPEYAFPIGQGSLALRLSQSLVARNKAGNISRTTFGVRYQLDNLAIDVQCYSDGSYSSQDYSVSWSTRW
jgi:hypothetical protein